MDARLFKSLTLLRGRCRRITELDEKNAGLRRKVDDLAAKLEKAKAQRDSLREHTRIEPGKFPSRPRLAAHAPGMDVAALRQETRTTTTLLGSFFDQPPASGNLQEDCVQFVEAFAAKLPFGLEDFGGMISPADAVFIDAMISQTRPALVVEIGVAYGYSSCFLLASMERHGLLEDGRGKLQSHDIESGVPSWSAWENSESAAKRREVGSLVAEFFPALLPSWDFRPQTTTLDIGREGLPAADGPVLALVDGAHWHPWPMVDACVLANRMPAGSWILMQDVSLAARNLYSSILFNVSANTALLGAQLVMEYWPGRKIRGIGGCFNMAALQVPADKESVTTALAALLQYPEEQDPGEAARDWLRDNFPTASQAPGTIPSHG